jgi:hypothetical protein
MEATMAYFKYLPGTYLKVKKVKLSLYRAMEAHRVMRR